jgi:radical SAM protein with 4Fe4S-binding SPASM domain
MNALAAETNTLFDEQIERVLVDAQALGVTAVEWLGGEPLLRGSLFDHMQRARRLGLRNNMWTGGLPLTDPEIRRRTAALCEPGLIAVHVSTVDPEVYHRLHPTRNRDDLAYLLEGVAATLALGYPAERMLNSITFTGLQSAADAIAAIDYFEREFGIRTCVNVFHTYLRPGTDPGRLAEFIPDDRSVARVYRRLNRQWGGGPLPLNCVDKRYCSATLAVLCDGSVTPCATIRPADAPNLHRDGSLAEIAARHRDALTFKRLRDPDNLPADCCGCPLEDRCWGCRSRAYAAGLGVEGKDPRCFRCGLSSRGDRRHAGGESRH